MALEHVTQCPVCSSTEFSDELICKDYTSSQEEFQIQSCNGCGLYLTNPRPDASSIGSYYESSDYISHTNTSKNLFDTLYLKARNFTLRWKQKLIQQRKEKGSLLDYGCGTGEFINHMQEQGWAVQGIEPSKNAREKANQLLNARDEVVCETLAQVGPGKFDVITLWHVLEHVSDPNETLQQLKGMLNQDGLLFVAVPNHESPDASFYKEHWAGYDVPRHLWHFTKTTMKELLANNNLEGKEIIPMKLDAYYVSLLSEKYKNRSRHNWRTPIQAFVEGLTANQKAAKDTNHSSLIYIARHA